ncbi:MAG: DUF4134 family protein [Prevotella sp.]|nr:DUF4134 family protein [Prevotella sp.]
MRTLKIERIILTIAGILIPLMSRAGVGITDYSGNSGTLVKMNVWVLVLGHYIIMLLYTIATLLGLYSAASIYIKLQTGEEGFTKSLVMLVGSCIFLVAAVHIFPAFFGRITVDVPRGWY